MVRAAEAEVDEAEDERKDRDWSTSAGVSWISGSYWPIGRGDELADIARTVNLHHTVQDRHERHIFLIPSVGSVAMALSWERASSSPTPHFRRHGGGTTCQTARAELRRIRTN